MKEYDFDVIKRYIDMGDMENAHKYFKHYLQIGMHDKNIDVQSDVNIVSALGIDLRYENDVYFTLSCGYNLSIVKFFHQNYGCDVNVHKGNALYIAISYGKVDVAKYLLDNGAVINDNAIDVAINMVQYYDVVFIDLLIDYGIDITKISERSVALKRLDSMTIKVLKCLSSHNVDINNFIQKC